VREAIDLEASLKTGELSLRNSGLEYLPPELFELTHLHALDISGNQITELSNIIKLKSLKSLRASINNISLLPEEIGQLTSLQNLELNANKLTCLPRSIGNLFNLEQLSIGKNPLTSIPDELSQLSSLRHLIANETGLREFPIVFSRLKKLYALNISGNTFTSIPHDFVNLTHLSLLHLDGCPLEIPPIEIVSRGPKAIINYLHAFDLDGPTFKLREAKLIIVGQGAVGKTCLVNRIAKDDYDPASLTTEGIEINKWKISASDGNPFWINIWDFGGQEIYHATHQFFLTKRSLYLFVWDARREDNILTFDYWFNVIKLLSDASPIIVTMNKSDERIKTIDEDSLIQKFPNIDSFHKVSAKTGTNINDLRTQICDAIVRLPHVGDVLPKSWQDIREQLDRISENCLSYDKYLNICAEYGLSKDKAGFLAQYYHDLGVFLHFSDNPILQKVIFLRPEWATNAVYRLVDTHEVVNAGGRFRLSHLDTIWADYPSEYHIHLLELMKKFELCFPVLEGETFIVPELLSTSRPQLDWVENNNLHFTYQYNFMPAGVITRFTVRVHDLIEGGIYWKNGVQISRDGTRGLVVAEPLNRRISISINGTEAQQLLAVIRREIDYIHGTLNHPTVQQLIPCVCRGCLTNPEPYMHDFDHLRRAKEKGKWTVECKLSLEDVPIFDVLRTKFEKKSKSKKKKQDRDITVYGDYYEAAQQIGTVINIGSISIRKEFSSEFGKRVGVTAHDYRKLVEALAKLPHNEITDLHYSGPRISDNSLRW